MTRKENIALVLRLIVLYISISICLVIVRCFISVLGYEEMLEDFCTSLIIIFSTTKIVNWLIKPIVELDDKGEQK